MYPNGIHALHKIDISDPNNPQDLGSIDIQSNWAYAAFDLFYPYLYGYRGNLPEDPSIEIINIK